MIGLLLAAAAHIPPGTPSAQSQASWIAYVWIAGMAVIVALLVWMAVTGRLFRRRR